MLNKEYVTLEEIAQRLKYSTQYLRNHWPTILAGIKPLKLQANRRTLFCWQDIEKLLASPK